MTIAYKTPIYRTISYRTPMDRTVAMSTCVVINSVQSRQPIQWPTYKVWENERTSTRGTVSPIQPLHKPAQVCLSRICNNCARTALAQTDLNLPAPILLNIQHPMPRHVDVLQTQDMINIQHSPPTSVEYTRAPAPLTTQLTMHQQVEDAQARS